MFATHYHELTDLAQTKERIKNFNFAVKEWRGEIIFLRNLLDGAASHSYGIHVARLAGMPAAVIARAKEILARLETSQDRRSDLPDATGAPAPSAQMGLFDFREARLFDQLRKLDVSL